jgi:hypothetical protein
MPRPGYVDPSRRLGGRLVTYNPKYATSPMPHPFELATADVHRLDSPASWTTDPSERMQSSMGMLWVVRGIILVTVVPNQFETAVSTIGQEFLRDIGVRRRDA